MFCYWSMCTNYTVFHMHLFTCIVIVYSFMHIHLLFQMNVFTVAAVQWQYKQCVQGPSLSGRGAHTHTGYSHGWMEDESGILEIIGNQSGPSLKKSVALPQPLRRNAECSEIHFARTGVSWVRPLWFWALSYCYYYVIGYEQKNILY